MRIISFENLKGGTGKTALSFSLAGMLAKQRKKVLIIDVDPQSNISLLCGIDNSKNEYDSMVEVFEKGKLPSHVIIKSPMVDIPNIDLIPASIVLTKTEITIINRPAREMILKNYIEKYISIFEKYDYIICDTAPSLNILNQNVFIASNSMLVVSDVGLNAFTGAKLLIDTWKDICLQLKIEDKIKGIVINRFDRRTKIGKDFMEFVSLNNDLYKLTFDTLIPENVKIKEVETANKPLPYYDSKCAAYLALREWVKELKEREIV